MISMIRWQDIADIIIMSFLAYQLYSWFKNSKAMQVLIGMGFLGGVYFVTKNLGLFMTSWILQELGTVLFILIIVIFQNEIRQALYRFSLLRNLFGRQESALLLDLKELADTVFALAAGKTGALIVLQRKEPVDEFLLHGIPLDSLVSGQLIGSIFQNGTPLHDGALVIRDGRAVCASCHLPLSGNSDVPQYLGTRHRAALGISERSDAVVLVVSEERGTVSLVVNGGIETASSPESLNSRLNELIYPVVPESSGVAVKRQLFSNLPAKAAVTLLVILSWLVISMKQGGLITVTAPIKFHNLPRQAALVKSVPEEVEVQLKMISGLIPSPKHLDLLADIDLGSVREGTSNLAISPDNFNLPLGVKVVSVNPATVKVIVDKRVSKTLRVKVRTSGSLPGGRQVRKIKVEPATVTVEGPSNLLSQHDSVYAEDLDLGGIGNDLSAEKRLLAPAPQIRVLYENPVKIRVFVAPR